MAIPTELERPVAAPSLRPLRSMREVARPARPSIVVAESGGFSRKALDLLSTESDVVLLDGRREELDAWLASADVLWVRLKHRIDRELLHRAKRLSVLVTPTTGLNHLDLDAAAERGIKVLSLQGRTEFLKDVRATAELTIGLMLSVLRSIPAASEHARGGRWERDLFRGRELYERKVGLVGFGRLGRIVARYLLAFGARVYACDPHVREGSMPEGVSHVTLEELLAQAELVSLHVNLTPGTRGFFSRRRIEAMRPGAYFVNTARGELVDEAALLDALVCGRLAGAALDVLADEDQAGMAGHPLVAYARENRNLILTPHVGGCTQESIEKTEMFLAERLADLLAEKSA